MPKKTTGLYQRNGIWQIDKKLRGLPRLRGSTGTADLAEAERILHAEIDKLRRRLIYGERRRHTFEEAAAKYLDEATHKSVGRDSLSLSSAMPFIGHLTLEAVHDESLREWVRNMREKGLSSATATRNLAVVRRIMTLASRKWREDGHTWIPSAPLITMPDWGDARKPYPLSWDEQRRLLQELPAHLVRATLYAVNTGLRSATQAALRWDWEVAIPEAGMSVFVVPEGHMKARNEHVVVHNRIAADVIEAQRGKHPDYVFTYKGEPVTRFANTAWKKARKRAGLDVRWHDLRHTYGRRLRAARVPLETRKALMGHVGDDITTHYSAAELQELVAAVRQLEKERKGTILRAVK